MSEATDELDEDKIVGKYETILKTNSFTVFCIFLFSNTVVVKSCSNQLQQDFTPKS